MNIIKRIIYNRRLNKHIENRHLYLWTSVFNKEGNILEKPLTRSLPFLTDDHLQKIVNFKKKNTPKVIHTEILLRKLYPIFSNNIEYPGSYTYID